jgi:drug/metabolite transporter (DMT)-like permease
VRVAALLLALSAAASWGIGGILLKKSLGNITPTTVIVFQYALGAVVIAGWLLATAGAGGFAQTVERRWGALLVLSVLQIAGYVFFVVAIKHAGEGSLPTSTVIAIAACYPALIAILSGPLLDERLGWNDFVGVGLIVAGVVVTQVR